MPLPNPVKITFQLRPRISPRERTSTNTREPQANGEVPAVTRALSMAIYFEHLIRIGDASDYATVSRMSGLCRERISQVMRLTCLSPDIQIELLYLPHCPAGRYPVSESAVRKIANLLSWSAQRREWAALKQKYRL